MPKLRIGELFRYARPYNSSPPIIDDLQNHFFVTSSPGQPHALLESGINSIGNIKAPDGSRRPAILIRSSPHKIGSHDTPWQDTFDPDNGHIHYYGDNKEPGRDPALAPGNKVLLEVNKFHSALDSELRKQSTPLIFYRAVSHNQKPKGFVEFNGFGIIRNIELVTQYDRKNERTFSNYAYDFVIFDISPEHEEFDWSWITDRRNSELTLENTLRKSPESWKKWIRDGPKSLERNRRRVSKLLVASTSEQIPVFKSREDAALYEIYQFYSERKNRFEALASIITARYIRDTGESMKKVG